MDGNRIQPENEVTDVSIDFKLKFSSHNSNICMKAFQHLNVLIRKKVHLTKQGKLTNDNTLYRQISTTVH